LEKNPFLENEDQEEEEEIYEKYVYHKPSRTEELTEAQKKRNLKGIGILMNNLKKIKPIKIR